jgi:hypothetical protein
MGASALHFATTARLLSAEARRLGLAAPGFRSPPRLVGADRSLRRRPGTAPTIAVRLAGRPRSAVVADMIEGVVVTNALAGTAADRCRAALWNVVEPVPIGPAVVSPASVSDAA